MIVEKVSLFDYRNILAEEISFSEKLNIISGQNGHGKTNILESIYLCSTGRSHRTRFEKELIRFGMKDAHVRVIINRDGVRDKIDVHLKADGKKGFAVNSVPIKKYGELFGKLLAVLFSPEEMRIVKNSPSDRRRFMDMELCQLSKIYYYNIKQYYRALKQRNLLLKKSDLESADKDLFDVWDSQLVLYGEKIIDSRYKFIELINLYASKLHEKISGGKKLKINYMPNTEKEDFLNKLKKDLSRDIILGSTQSGPHRDDLSFEIDGKDVRAFGSQGEQRTAAICVKLSEIKLMEEKTGTKPVVLLDDVFSELDDKRKAFLMEMLEDNQVIITCTDKKEEFKDIMDISYINILNGKVID